MSVLTAFSSGADAVQAVAEVKRQLTGTTPALVVAFASAAMDPGAVSAGLAEAFPEAKVIGCTTAGEIVSGRMLKHSLVVMALDDAFVADVSVQVVSDLSQGVDVESAFAGFASHFGSAAADLSLDEYVGLVFVDGLSGAEERLMEAVGNRTNVVFVGGSAGDDLAFTRTHVFADGQAVSDAAVLALLKPAVPFKIVKTQSFVATDQVLVATETDEAAREVISFNGKPAVEAYAQAIGRPVDQAADGFMNHPVGLMIDGEPYVRSPQQVLENGTIRFYCNIVNGMGLSVLEGTDIIADTKSALAEAADELGGISALINFNCILRTLELEAEGRTGEYGALFSDVPTVGFSTYGEQYFGHINQTATMLALGQR